jgi:hypothetical protein
LARSHPTDLTTDTLHSADRFWQRNIKRHKRNHPDQGIFRRHIEFAQHVLEMPLLHKFHDYSPYVHSANLEDILALAKDMTVLKPDGSYENPIPLVDRVEDLKAMIEYRPIPPSQMGNLYKALPYRENRIAVMYGISDPLIEILLNSEKHSFGHLELVRRATEIYDGDVLVGLAVISFVFAKESDFNLHRKYNGVLTTRLKPLFTDDRIDDIGYNYHFWAYLLHAMQGRSFRANVFSFLWEARDPGDRAADKAGMKIGNYIRSHVGQDVACPKISSHTNIPKTNMPKK